MITICIKPIGEFNWASIPETYDGKFIDDFCIKCRFLYIEVEPNEIDADYDVEVYQETGIQHGSPIFWKTREISRIDTCEWDGHPIINDEDVCIDLEERARL